MLNRREFLSMAGSFAGAAAATGGVGWLFRRVLFRPAAAAPRAVTAICKNAWGARPVADGFVPHTIDRLTVHHTAALLSSNPAAPGRLRGHQRFHQQAGWPDLAYHFVVDGNGHVYEGRPAAFRGDTFTEYDPTGHFLVSCEGDFNRQAPPDPQLAALADVLAWAAGEFGVPVDTIAGHDRYAATTCPGAALTPLVADGTLEAMTRARLDAGGVVLAQLCGTAADDLVAAIEAGTDTPGAAPVGRFFLRHSNTPGAADEEFVFGLPGWVPVSGNLGEPP